MKVNKSSWHYKVWKWSHAETKAAIQPTLCSYWRRIFLLAPILAVAYCTCLVIAFVMYVCHSLLCLFLGYKGAGDFSSFMKSPSGCERYKPFFTLGNIDIYPVHLFVAIMVMYLAGITSTRVVSPTVVSFAWDATNGWTLFHSAVAVSIIFSLFHVIYKFRSHLKESWSLTRAWLKAKKDKVCPLIEFED